MLLSNPVAGIFGKGMEPAEAAAKLRKRDKNAMECLAEIAESNDRKALAYIWIAVELGCNIIVFGENGADLERFVDAVSVFVPPHMNLMDLRTGRASDPRINFMGVIQTGKLAPQRNQRIAERYMPDYVISTNVRNGELNDTFALSKHGVSFISQITGDFINMPIVKALQSRPFKVEKRNIQMLDLSVFIENEGNAIKLKTITEYRWLCRAETVKYKEKSMVEYSNMHIACNGNLDDGKALKSKVMGTYGRLSLFSEEETMEELHKRANFLSSLGDATQSVTGHHSVEMYYEIK